ncbi:hypothetical protein NKJ48_32080 [Mesorhizobium sp. M0114]|uniref:hypothetical protein n=1 Tax=unclassified Mesorhizobium TaxID=325217 RepID=UPI00333D15B8
MNDVPMKSVEVRVGDILVVARHPVVRLRTCGRFATSEAARHGEVDVFDAHGIPKRCRRRNDAEG